MSVPPTIRRLLDLLERLAHRDPEVDGGPFRVEATVTALGGPEPVDARLAELLQAAVFLGVSLEPDAPADSLERLDRVTLEKELLLDLRLDACWLEQSLPPSLGSRTARLEVSFPGPAALDAEPIRHLVAWRDAVAGSVLARIPVTAADLAGDPAAVLEPVANAHPDVAVKLLPATTADFAALREAWEALESAAQRLKLNLSVRPLGEVPAGPLADPLAIWNVVQEGLRSAFRRHPELCPLPWLMVRRAEDGGWHACPQPPESGPDPLDAEAPFTGDRARHLRQSFFDGAPPPACARCTLRPRLLRSLVGDD